MEIEVFCPLLTYHPWLKPKSFEFVRADLSYSPPDVRAHYIEYPALPIVSRPLNGFISARRLLPHVKQFAPDLILNYGVYPEGYAAVTLAGKLGVPVVLGAIGSDINRIPDAITRRLTRTALSQASFTLTVSEHLRTNAI